MELILAFISLIPIEIVKALWPADFLDAVFPALQGCHGIHSSTLIRCEDVLGDQTEIAIRSVQVLAYIALILIVPDAIRYSRLNDVLAGIRIFLHQYKGCHKLRICKGYTPAPVGRSGRIRYRNKHRIHRKQIGRRSRFNHYISAPWQFRRTQVAIMVCVDFREAVFVPHAGGHPTI